HPRRTSTLSDFDRLIRFHVVHDLRRARRPLDFDANGRGSESESEMDSRVRGRRVAAGRRHRTALIADDDTRAEAVPVRLRADQPDVQPAVPRRALVLPNLRRRSQREDDEVETAVAIEIRHAAAAVNGDALSEP